MKILLNQNHNQLIQEASENILKKITISKSFQLIESIVKQNNSEIAVLDNQLRYLTVSQKWLQQYSLSLSDVINKNYLEVFGKNSPQEKAIYENCLAKSHERKIHKTVTDSKGNKKQLKLSIYPWYNEQNQLSGIIIFCESLFNVQSTLESFFDDSLDMFCLVGLDGYFKQVNSAFQQTLGYSELELTAQPLLHFVHPEDVAATKKEIANLKQGIPSIKFENRYRCQDGSYCRLQWMMTPPQNKSNLVYGSARDITQSYQLQQQLSWESKHDHLTGLLNRREFEKRINKAIKSVKDTDRFHAFCYLDLDRFKVINDVCGHLTGDELLREITKLIKEELRESDTLSRLGGDEFGLLLEDCCLKDAEKIAHNIREKIKNFRFSWQNNNFVLGVSIGLVAIDKNSRNFSYLLSAADAACYAAKDQGRNGVRVYHPEDKELAQQRDQRHWISKLNLALEENRFCLYCQKITPLQQNSGVDHYEILLRLLNQDGSLVPPMAFIPAAERYDLMPSIDRWVISTFLNSYQKYCQLHQSSPGNESIYTINLSGASINSDRFFRFLKEQFTLYDVAPEKICFEITETSAIANLQKAATFINEIKELGCSFALDDFGSGMSSLTYLKNLPVDYLKIDGNFVKNIVNDPIDRATVECFNRIGEVMNIQTIAEFVENDAIIAQLKEIGVNYAQGYGIDKPAPLSFMVMI